MSSRASVVNLDPETNPKLKEILDILLLAGYFRIRIPSISPLDKILGGLSWCITQSNFDIDIDYNDEFNIGQKIKVSEKIVSSLEHMSCPSKLQPHQIQGLDLTSIYPIVQWLIRFVLDTREFRQDQNKRVTKFVGTNTLEALQFQNLEERKGIKEVVDQLDLIRDKRGSKNVKTIGLSKKDPLRVYSALIEYGDLSSQRTYNKLCAIVSGTLNLGQVSHQAAQGKSSVQKQQTTNEKAPLTIGQLLFQDDEKEMKKSKQVNVSYTNLQKVTVENIQNIDKEKIQQAQKQIQEMSAGQGPSLDSTLDVEEEKQFKTLARRNSIQGQNISQLINQQKEKISESMKPQVFDQEEDDILNTANILKQEKQLHEQQTQLYNKNLQNFDKRIQELVEEQVNFKEQDAQYQQQFATEDKQKKQIDDTLKIIGGKMLQIRKSKDEAEIKKAEDLVQKRQDMKEEKSQLRKQIQEQMKELEKEKEICDREIPQDDEIQVVQELKQEYNQKKEKYDKKFTQFAQLNQELAVLQRKIENYPSPSEIAQYYQRFVELYDGINQEMEEYKKQFTIFNNLQDAKSMAIQFADIMRTFKENYSNNLKDKKGKEELNKNLGTTYNSLKDGLIRCQTICKQQKDKRDKLHENYIQQTQIEREYFRLLKEIKMEFEKNEQITKSEQ